MVVSGCGIGSIGQNPVERVTTTNTCGFHATRGREIRGSKAHTMHTWAGRSDRIHVLDDLPKGPSGKVQRLKLHGLVYDDG